VCSFTQAGLDAVAVVLGDTEDGRPEDIRKLMAFSHEVTPGFIVPAYTGSVENVMVRHGEKTKTVLATDAVTYAYPASNDAGDIRTVAEHGIIEAPVKKGQEVGKFLVYADDELIGEHKLLATEDIDTGWLPSYIYISNEATLNAMKVIGAFILLLFAVSLIGRKRRKARRKKKSASEAQRQMREQNAAGVRADRKSRKETRKRLREKYREKH
jgi:D-alanyl-D-alanine carboxypeptidase (penicillin-binding protein 5/6)